MIPGSWRVASHAHQITHSQRRGRQQVGLQGEPVTVATGDLQHWFEASFHQETRYGKRRHAHARAMRIGEVERIRYVSELLSVGQQGGESCPFWWVQLRRDHKFP